MNELYGFDWTLVRSFIAVLDEGSLLGASRRLGLTQATLSRHVAELERQLDVALFERSGRGAVATAAARAIVPAARRMEADAVQIAAAVGGLRQQAQGTVKISCSRVVAAFMMPRLIADLQQRHTGLQVELVATDQVSNLLRRDADVAVRLVRPRQSALVARRIAAIPMGAFASRDYVRRRGAPRDLRELVDHRIVGLDADDTLVAALGRRGLAVTRDSFCVRTDDHVAGIRLVEAGAGIGFMPAYAAAMLDDVVPVMPQLAVPALPVWLAVHREIRGNRLIRTAFDDLAAAIPALLRAR